MSTYQNMAINALARCRFAPATFDKKFAHSLAAMPEDVILTARQRSNLWRLVVRYRKQIAHPALLAHAREWLAVLPERRAFEDFLDADPCDWNTRCVFADWLEESGNVEEAAAQRWMSAEGSGPELRAAGQSYGPNGTTGINYEWHFYPYDRMFGDAFHAHFIANCWWRSREAAEREIVKAVTGQGSLFTKGATR